MNSGGRGETPLGLRGHGQQMSFRITTSTDGKKTTIRVEGHLDATAVPDLQREVQFAKAPSELELSGTISADAEGIRQLQTLSAQVLQTWQET